MTLKRIFNKIVGLRILQIIVIIFAIACVEVLYYLFLRHLFPLINVDVTHNSVSGFNISIVKNSGTTKLFDNVGVFGDSFGALNSILTIVTVISIYLSFRQELKKSAEATSSLIRQQERTEFFTLLEQLRHTIDNFIVTDNVAQNTGRYKILTVKFRGLDAFIDIINDIKSNPGNLNNWKKRLGPIVQILSSLSKYNTESDSDDFYKLIISSNIDEGLKSILQEFSKSDSNVEKIMKYLNLA